MANSLYNAARQAFGSAGINLLSDTIKAVLVDVADYTVDLAVHDNLDDVPALARVATATLASKTLTAGVFDAADTVFTGVTGDEFEALILYKDTGVESTSTLIAYIDTGTGFPLTPNGGNVTATWNNGASKILAI